MRGAAQQQKHHSQYYSSRFTHVHGAFLKLVIKKNFIVVNPSLGHRHPL